MATLKEQAERLKRINLKNAVNEVLFFSDEILISMNKSQLAEGNNNEGNLIDRYRKFTKRIAEQELSQSEAAQKEEGFAYNMQWSGDFFDAFTVKQVEGGVKITSTVSYLDSINRLGSRNRAQNKLFGLDPENKKKFIQKHLLQRVQALIKETQ